MHYINFSLWNTHTVLSLTQIMLPLHTNMATHILKYTLKTDSLKTTQAGQIQQLG